MELFKPFRQLTGLTSALILLAAGCAATEKRHEEVNTPQHRLSAEFVNKGDHLEIFYRFPNGRKQDIVIFDEIPASNEPGARDFDQNSVYIEDYGAGDAHMFKTIETPPKGYSGIPITIRGKLLAPGQELSARINVPLPLKLRTPYRKATQLSQEITDIYLCVGFATADKVIAEPGGDQQHPIVTQVTSLSQFTACTATQTITELPSTPRTDSPIGPWPTIPNPPQHP